MNVIKSIVIAGAALVIAAPAFAGRDGTDLFAQDRAVKKLPAQKESASQGTSTAGPRSGARAYNYGHPTERVRR